MSIGPNPIVVNAIVDLDHFTLENGATFVAPESWTWERNRQPTNEEMVRAVMKAGDAVLFRADLIHGGGANESDARRRGISLTYCAGWLRPVENSVLNLPPNIAADLPSKVTRLLGYASHDASSARGGLLGLYEGGDPAKILMRDSKSQ
jgi:ectoine hydroxylase-related dioxygenase (phytanoyl-CoA dioxygenase family)